MKIQNNNDLKQANPVFKQSRLALALMLCGCISLNSYASNHDKQNKPVQSGQSTSAQQNAQAGASVLKAEKNTEKSAALTLSASKELTKIIDEISVKTKKITGMDSLNYMMIATQVRALKDNLIVAHTVFDIASQAKAGDQNIVNKDIKNTCDSLNLVTFNPLVATVDQTENHYMMQAHNDKEKHDVHAYMVRYKKAFSDGIEACYGWTQNEASTYRFTPNDLPLLPGNMPSLPGQQNNSPYQPNPNDKAPSDLGA